MSTGLIVLIVGLFGLIATLWVSYKLGRVSVLKEQAQATVGVKNEQLQAVVNKPDSIDRMSSGTF
jgi:hypothetical protein